MKRISFWAKGNPAKAITLIVVLNILLLFLSFYIGNALHFENVTLPKFYAVLCLPVMAFIALKYDKVKEEYYKRKRLEFSFLSLCFIAIIIFSNQLNKVNYSTAFAATFSLPVIKEKKPTAAEILESLKYRDKSSLTRVEKRILKKEFKVQLKKHVQAKLAGDKESSKRTWLTILAIIAALGLTLLLTSLVCSLSCGGADAAAVIVAIVGMVGIIWGAVAWIKHINRKKAKAP